MRSEDLKNDTALCCVHACQRSKLPRTCVHGGAVKRLFPKALNDTAFSVGCQGVIFARLRAPSTLSANRLGKNAGYRNSRQPGRRTIYQSRASESSFKTRKTPGRHSSKNGRTTCFPVRRGAQDIRQPYPSQAPFSGGDSEPANTPHTLSKNGLGYPSALSIAAHKIPGRLMVVKRHLRL